MTGPLLILAVLSVIGGYHSLFPNAIVGVVIPDLEIVAALPNHMWMIVLGTFAWVVGLITARAFYSKTGGSEPLQDRYPAFLQSLQEQIIF